MKRPAANIPQEQRAGKGTILNVVADALPGSEDLKDGALGDAPLGQLLQDVLAPLDPPVAQRLPQEFRVQWLHALPSTSLISSGVRP